MSTVTDIFYSAWNKDAVGLKAAIDDVMSTRIADQIATYTTDVAASVFGATVGETEQVENTPEQPIASDTVEEQPNENI